MALVSGGPAFAEMNPAAQGGLPPEVLSFPDLIIHHAKVVTMDDAAINTSPGTLAEAVAVRDGKILAVGGNDDVLRLAGPKTQQIDARGRTVIPGIIDVHTHLHDFALTDWLRKASPPPVAQFSAVGQSFDEMKRNIEVLLKERASRVRPGEWVVVDLPRSDDRGIGTSFIIQRKMTIKDLDRLMPENPLLVASHPAYLINSKGKAALKGIYGFEPSLQEVDETGYTWGYGVEYRRGLVVDDRLKDDVEVLAEIARGWMDKFASAGMTTWSSHIMGKSWFNAYMKLVRENKMPMRFAYAHYNGALLNPYSPVFYSRLGDMTGLGTDYFWQAGVSLGYIDSGPPLICTSIPGGPEGKWCRLAPGSKLYEMAYEAVVSGSRVVLGHNYGDKSLDHFMDLLEDAMKKEPHVTLDYIRSRRMTTDHCGLYPRPDQIARLKKLGMMISCSSEMIDRTWIYLKDYGLQYGDWVSPVKDLLDGGVKVTFESELTPAEDGLFKTFVPYITRKTKDGNVISAKNAVDRVTVMKMATIWPAEFLLKEDVLGSLQPGKWADLLILNKDYFNVPVEEIATVYPLMTVLGGKAVFLHSEFAKELGLPPAGTQLKYRFEH
ncbi:MAG: amidohydrolase family protein [Acidobacteria bacterium]|nr:amidohydrolase family protein [Acidobacteriota bacterium]